MKTIKLDNEIQVLIFLILYKNKEGVSRDFLIKKLKKPRTTIYDNIAKMYKKKLKGIPYVKFYDLPNNKVGRPIRMFFIPKGIRDKHIDFRISN